MSQTGRFIIIALTVISCLPGLLYGQTTPVPITVEPLTGNLFKITCNGGQEYGLPAFGIHLIASIGSDGILLVDAGFGSTAEALRDTLAAYDNGKTRIIINTHAHGDHASGNYILKDKYTILAHRNAVEALSGSYYNLPGSPSPNRPQVGFDDSLVIFFNGDEIHVVHTPRCHTNGDAYVYFKNSGIVAMGDLIFADELPYVDLNSGGSVSGYTDRIKSFIADFPENVTFVGSHGRKCDKNDLKKYHEMLIRTTQVIRDAAAAGKTPEQMIQDSVLSDWADWAGSFATTTPASWITIVNFEVSGGINSKPSICEPLTKILATGLAAEAISEYQKLKASRLDDYNYGEAELNMLGYQLLFRQRVDDALEILKLNLQIFPNSFNVYDSYGEALMTKGDTTQSIANYEKSLELNPGNNNAVEMLKRLKP